MRRSLTARVLAAGALLALAAATAARAQGVEGGRDEARASEACGCGVGPFPCDAYGAADAVFAGVVASVDPVRWSGDGKSFSTRGRVTRFEVGEAFRGVSPGAVEVFDRGTLNDYRFTAGEEYFVYARRDPQTGKLYVCTCGHTKRLMFAEEDRDLAYARAVAGGELTPSIVGRVSRLERAGGPSAFTNSAAAEGIVVTAEGAGGTFEGFEYLLTAEVRAKRTARHSQTGAFSLGPMNEPLKLTVSRPGYYVPRYARRRASN